jgi:YD repeat-containing protein
MESQGNVVKDAGADERRRPHRSRVSTIVRVLLWSVLLFVLGVAHATSYVYDANGRVVAVTQNTGVSAQYTYDAVGNLVQVGQVAAGQLAIFAFTPTHGSAGTSVTVYGQGFSATAGANLVSFNGTAATVSSATATQLVTTVPVGASTGAITVTTGGQTATSSTPFVVDDTGAPPTISQVSPLIVAVGSTVTVTGTHLDPTAGTTTVFLAGTPVSVASASDTQLQFSVPANAGSGYVQVQTLYGQATSAAPILVVPNGITPAQVVSSSTASVGGAGVNMSIGQGGQTATLSFQGTSGAWLSLQGSAITTTANAINYSVYGPGNQLVAQGAMSASSPTIHLPRLTTSGTYIGFFTPDTAGAQLTVGIESNPTLTTSAALAVAAAAPYQSKREVFTVTQGQNLELTLNNAAAPGSYNNGFRVDVYSAAGVDVAGFYCYGSNPASSCMQHLWNMAAGTYSVIATPVWGGTISFNALITADLAGPAIATGGTAAVNLSAGQVERLTFSGNVGDTIALNVTGVTTTPTGNGVTFLVYRPDAGTITTGTPAYTSFDTASGQIVNLANLPVSGMYTVIVAPDNGLPATATIGVVAGSTGTIPTTGTSGSYTANASGENVYLSFAATQGQNLELTLNNATVPGAGYNAFIVTVYNASGGQVGSLECFPGNPAGSCTQHLWNLAAGTYSVIATPNWGGTISFNALITADLAGPAIATGGTAAVNLSAGQVERLTFSGNVGDTIALNVTGVTTTPTGNGVTFLVYRPDAGTITTGTPAYTSFDTASGQIVNLANLPVSGMYTVIVAPDNGLPATATIGVVAGSTGTIPTTGTSGSYTANASGENVYLSFAATQGQNLELTLNNATVPGAGYNAFIVTVYNASGGQVGSLECFPGNPAGSCTQHLWNLAAGTYSVIATPNWGGTISFNALITADLAGPAIATGGTAAVNLSAGQVERLTFSGNVGDTIALNVTGVTTTPTGNGVTFLVYRPDAGTITTGTPAYTSFDTASGQIVNLANLPVSGMYTVIVAPDNGLPATATIGVVAGSTGTIPTTGTSGSYTANASGENVYLSFAATQGQNLELTLNNATVPGAGYNAFIVTVYNASGGQVGSLECFPGNPAGSCTQHLWNLAAGTYSVIATPNWGGTISFNALITADLAGPAIATGGTAAVNLSAGQVERLTFSGNVGDTIALNVTGVTTTPTGNGVTFLVYRPDAGTITTGTPAYTSFDTASGQIVNLANLPVSGMYTVIVAPDNGLPATATIGVVAGSTGTIPTTGTSGSYTANASGENVYLSFAATQGQNLELTLNNATVPGAGYNAFIVTVYNASGGQVGSLECFPGNPAGSCTQHLWNLAAGTYSVIATPNWGGTISFNALITADLAGPAIATGGTAAVNLSAGQVERLTFSGNVGDTIALNVTGVTTTPTGNGVTFLVYRPDAGTITTGTPAYTSFDTASGQIVNLANLPVSGMYTVIVAPDNGLPATAIVGIASDTAGPPVVYGDPTLPIAGAPQSQTSSGPGQNVTMTFNATQGQNLELTLSDVVAMPSNNPVLVSVSTSAGNVISSNTYCNPSTTDSCRIALWNLAAGTYSVTVTPYYGQTDTISFGAQIQPDVVGPALTANTSTSVNLAEGQVERMTFTANLGDTVALSLSNVSTTPAGQIVGVNVYRPDGGQITTTNWYTDLRTGGATMVNLPNLPVGGTYTLAFYTDSGEPAIAQFAEYTSATGTPTASVPVNGTVESYSAKTGGQNVYLTFDATQGQNLELTLGNVVAASGNPVYVSVNTSSGVNITTAYCNPSTTDSCRTALWNLAAGTYSVVVSPYPYGAQTDTISFSAQIQPDVVGPALTANTPATVNLAAGEVERMTFTANLGDTVALALSNVSTTPAGQIVGVNVYRPDGGQITTTNWYTDLRTGGTTMVNLPNLPAGGTYTLAFYTDSGEPATAQFAEYTSATGTPTASVPVNGTVENYSAQTGGQDVYLTFNATQGQNLELTLGNVVAASGNPVYVSVNTSSGVNITTAYCNPSTTDSCRTALWNLAAGTYSVVVSPYPYGAQTDTISFSAQIQPDVVGPALTANTPATVNLAAGEVERMTFTANLGDTVALALSNVSTTPAGQIVGVNVYRPDGGQITTTNWYTDLRTGGTTMVNLPNLPAGGTYTLAFYTDSGEPATAQFAEYTSATGTPTASVPMNGTVENYSAQTGGQDVYLTFNATQGQNLELTLGNVVAASGNPVYVSVNTSSGVNITTAYCNPSTTDSCRTALWNLAAGTYSVVVSPYPYGAQTDTISFSAQIQPDVVGPALTTNTPATVNLAAGEVERLTFNANLGDTIALTLSGVSTTPAGQAVNINVYRPDGGAITTGNYYTSLGTASTTMMNLANLPAAGAYTLVAYTTSGTPATAQIAQYASATTTPTGTLPTNDTVESYSAETGGQDVYLTFNATQGQNLELTLGNVVAASGNPVYVSVNTSTGVNITTEYCYPSTTNSCRTALWNLAAGTYSVTVSPYPYGAQTDTISFSAQIAPDVVGPALTANTPATINLAAGGLERVTFNANMGDTVALALSNVSTTPTGQAVNYNLYRPDTGQITTGNYYTSTGTAGSTLLNLPSLPATGQYTLALYTNSGAPATAQLTWFAVTGQPVTETVQNFAPSAAGQSVFLVFTPTQGQDLKLALTNLSITGSTGNAVQVLIDDPAGNTVANVSCVVNAGVNCLIPIWKLSAGQYSVIVSPPDANSTISFGASLEPNVNQQ